MKRQLIHVYITVTLMFLFQRLLNYENFTYFHTSLPIYLTTTRDTGVSYYW